MNIGKLKVAEQQFYKKYPGGFEHPYMLEIEKRHKMDKMIAKAQDIFERKNFDVPSLVLEPMVKLVNASSMVSMFEKPKFKEMAKGLSGKETNALIGGLEQWLYGNKQKGFEMMLRVLNKWKVAKWPLLTICPNYFHPDFDVFIKPTTAKSVIQFFELDGLEYKPAPSWDFYQRYCDEIHEMKSHVDYRLYPNNAAFCGFLMMSMDSSKAGI